MSKLLFDLGSEILNKLDQEFGDSPHPEGFIRRLEFLGHLTASLFFFIEDEQERANAITAYCEDIQRISAFLRTEPALQFPPKEYH